MSQLATREEYEREVEVIDGTSLAVVSRQEIDAQIATAHKFPRSITGFRDEVVNLATLNEMVAAECSYALPRDGKLIEGPSARFAEILLSAWGNARAAARVVGDDGVFITAQGAFHDLQKNSAVAFEVRKRVTDKYGKRFSNDMIVMTGNAVASIALRNAILKGIPKALWADLWQQARQTAIGDHKTLANRRAEALKLFQNYGVNQEQLLAFLQINGVEDISSNHLLTLRGLVTAFKEGDIAPEEVFAQPAQKQNGRKSPTQKLDEFANGNKSKDPAEAPHAEAEGSESSPEDAAPEPESASPPSSPANGDGGADSTSQEMSPDIQRAYNLGRAACKGGHTRELPKNLKGTGKPANAFLRGWDDEADAADAAGGG